MSDAAANNNLLATADFRKNLESAAATITTLEQIIALHKSLGEDTTDLERKVAALKESRRLMAEAFGIV
jgi:hypothetical protein